MIVYRRQIPAEPALTLWHRLHAQLRNMQRQQSVPLADARWCLVVAGQIESAIADRDELSDAALHWRQLSVLCGYLLTVVGQARPAAIASGLDRLADLLKQSVDLAPPPDLKTTVPEGFAFYGLFPDQYIRAAQQFHQRHRPAHAVIMGVRSIGTALSGAVVGALQAEACLCESLTVRPTGHPFERQLTLHPAVRQALEKRRESWALVVDEGPGISGSSFAACVDALRECGFAPDRIALLPSWLPDASQLRSARAAKIWTSTSRFHVPFEAITPTAQPLFPGYPVLDWSAGAWRQHRPTPAPIGRASHEARKYLTGSGKQRLVWKFQGLGTTGDAALERAQQLAAERVHPAPVSLSNGFLNTPYLPGNTLDRADGRLAAFSARYLCLAHDTAPRRGQVSWHELLPMVECNLSALDPQLATAVSASISANRAFLEDHPAIVTDSRMMADEWIETPNGFYKLDSLHHGDGHFLPGPTDPAWDVAGTLIECDWSTREKNDFLVRYQMGRGDRSLTVRLPFYELAYAAFRFGYICFNIEQTAGEEQDCWRLLAWRYRHLLLSSAQQIFAGSIEMA